MASRLRLVASRGGRAQFIVRVRIGQSSTALTQAIYQLAWPCIPDHRMEGVRETFRFWADDENVRRVRAMLLNADELLEYDMEYSTAPLV